MNFHDFTKNLIVKMQEESCWEVCKLRRYLPPSGYLNPKYNSLAIASALFINQKSQAMDAVQQISLLIAWRLWHPATFDWNYKMHHEKSDPQGGHHASPRLHPRRGHWRHQRFGKELSQMKVIWIEPVLVGAK